MRFLPKAIGYLLLDPPAIVLPALAETQGPDLSLFLV
jgi:hypothetical protein